MDLAFRHAVSTILLNDAAGKNINVSDNFIAVHFYNLIFE